MFKFLQRPDPGAANTDTAARMNELATLARTSPLHGQMGAAKAASAFAAVAAAMPGSATFLAAPETAGHRDAVREGLTGVATTNPPGRTTVIVYDAGEEALGALSIGACKAQVLADGVADAIEMLAITLPAAFDSDGYRVARMALDEELRSSHDEAIDGLKRRAAHSNIGLLQTPLGYAIAPMHDGRVVAPEVVKALPDALKAEVDSKLAAFEAELSRALENRSGLQQAYASARRDLDRETAALAVRAALSLLAAKFSSHADVTNYLDGLRADLVRNAALFLPHDVTAAKPRPRAPAELAADPRLARFRVALPCQGAPSQARLVHVHALDRASLLGSVHKPAGAPVTPACVRAGSLSRAGRGIAVIAVDDLVADPEAWPLLRRTLRTGAAVPMVSEGADTRLSGLEMPIDCRIVITGSAQAYAAWCGRDPAIKTQVLLVTAFEQTTARSPDTERELARHAAAIAADLDLPPLDGETIAALIGARTETRGKQAFLSTDLDAVRSFLLARPARAAQGAAQAQPERDEPAAADAYEAADDRAEPPAIRAAA